MEIGQGIAGLIMAISGAIFLFLYFKFETKHPESSNNENLNDLAAQIKQSDSGLVKTLKTFTFIRAFLKPSRRTVAVTFGGGMVSSGVAIASEWNWMQELWKTFSEWVNSPPSKNP